MTDTPHDALFRFAFSRPELAADELRLILPPELVAHADWSTLAPQPGSFIDDDLSSRACDLLFSVQLGGRTALLYVLFEHQSTRDRWPPLRLLRYQVRIWTQYLSDHPEAEGLPPIISAVLQHDPRSGPPPPCFAELLDADEELMTLLQPFVPDFRFALDALREADSEELRRRSMAALGRLAPWCLKNGRDVGEIVDRLAEWADVFREVRSAPHGVEAIAAVMRYIRRVNDEVPNERLEKLLESVLDAEFREVYVTEGERLIQRGREEGREEGLLEGQRQLVLQLLESRFGELDDTMATRVRRGTKDELQRWARRVIDAETAEDVLA